MQARVRNIDPRFLPKTRVQMVWSKVPGGAGGGRLGVCEGDWWIGQVRVMRKGTRKIWRAQLQLNDGISVTMDGICESWGDGETKGLQWLNDELISFAELRHRVNLCRNGPWRYDGTEIRAPEDTKTLEKVEPARRPWWRWLADLLFGPPTKTA